jgi:hypothetical protein
MFTQQMLSASNDRVELSLAAARSSSHSFRKNLTLGIKQILMGYNRLPFLVVLVLVSGVVGGRGRGIGSSLHNSEQIREFL